MLREAQIPLALWLSAAILAHLAGGGSAVEVARVVEEREDVLEMMKAVREGLRPDMTFEIMVTDAAPTPAAEPKPPVNPPDSDEKADPSDKDPDKKAEPPKEKPKPRKPKLLPKV